MIGAINMAYADALKLLFKVEAIGERFVEHLFSINFGSEYKRMLNPDLTLHPANLCYVNALVSEHDT